MNSEVEEEHPSETTTMVNQSQKTNTEYPVKLQAWNGASKYRRRFSTMSEDKPEAPKSQYEQ